MNVFCRFVALLFWMSMEAGALVVLQRSNPRERHLQREENESDPAATEFLAKVAAPILKDDLETEDFSKFGAFVDALVAHGSLSSESPFYSNWSSVIERERDAASGPDIPLNDVGSPFTPSPSMSNETEASTAFDHVVGSTSSANGDLEGTVGGNINMADGENVPSSSTSTELPSGIILSIIAANALALLVEMTN